VIVLEEDNSVGGWDAGLSGQLVGQLGTGGC
jgi:hypothetical protein